MLIEVHLKDVADKLREVGNFFERVCKIHRELSELGMRAREAACGSLESLMKRLGLHSVLAERGYLALQHVARLREVVRRELAPIIKKIDERVGQLLEVRGKTLFDYF
ncbi:MAG: hypothetical protein QXI84_09225 [Thermofilaceae archaeon]